MRFLRLSIGVAALLIAPVAQAQTGSGDIRIQSIEYRNNQVVRVRTTPGFQLTIELAPDEMVQSMALGDNSAFQVSANKAGDHLFIKPLQADISTNLTVVTDVRTYNFELTSTGEASADLPYAIRFTYPNLASPPPMSPTSSAGVTKGRYRLKGDRALRPKAISDDGLKTYIEWPADGALPAVYSLERDGRETLANGNMRGAFFVIDGVARRLIFRVDHHRAQAVRLEEPEAEGDADGS
jgi:type IV secretion system protein VirB9